MPPAKTTYTFDVDGHTVVTAEKEQKKPSKVHTPEWLSQALNEGDGVYRP